MSRRFSRIFSDILQILDYVSRILTDFSDIARIFIRCLTDSHGLSDDVSQVLTDFLPISS